MWVVHQALNSDLGIPWLQAAVPQEPHIFVGCGRFVEREARRGVEIWELCGEKGTPALVLASNMRLFA